MTSAIIRSFIIAIVLVPNLFFSVRTAHSDVVYFSEDFSGSSLNPLLSDPDTAFTVGSGVVRRTSSTGDSDRHYVSTVFAGFDTVNFVAEVTLNQVDQNGGGNLAWFGLGPGSPDSEIFNEPDGVFFRIHPLDLFNVPRRGDIDVAVNEAGDDVFESLDTIGTLSTSNSTHRLRMTKIGGQLTFAVDENFGGTFAADMQFTITDLGSAAPFLNSTNSRIFFGTGRTDHSFDDLSISAIPEPTSVVIYCYGAAALVVFRRRRRPGKWGSKF